MNRFLLGACLAALPLYAMGAPSQYVVIDLGLQDGGEGLLWQTPGLFQQCMLIPPYYPSLGGANCILAYNSIAQVGTSATATDGQRAVMWTSSRGDSATIVDLGLLPNAQQNGAPPNSYAFGLNRVGDVVGQSDTGYPSATPPAGGFAAHGFRWSSGVMSDLGAIAGNDYSSSAEGVNDSQEIVGWTNTVSSVNGNVLRRAFVWEGGAMYNLTFYLVGGATVLLSDATAIDCQGNIAAVGAPATGGGTHNYLLVRQGAARTNCPAQ
jgi:probable HAF family extracellular repeat protein